MRPNIIPITEIVLETFWAFFPRYLSVLSLPVRVRGLKSSHEFCFLMYWFFCVPRAAQRVARDEKQGGTMYGVRLKISGDYALFTRPELKAERVSYDTPTPSALRGILEAIHWKPALSWRVDAVHIMRPIVFENIRRNELGSQIPLSSVLRAMKGGGGQPEVFIENDRQQRGALILKNVEYIVEAHFVLTAKAGSDERPGKHLDIFNRRLAKGQVFQQPCLGCREFPAYVEPADRIPTSVLAEKPEGNRDLGWMLYDLDYGRGERPEPMFFRAKLEKGILRVPPPDSGEVRR
jgi:CRISPR-associated protein Cas5d